MPTPPLTDEQCREAVEVRSRHRTTSEAALELGLSRSAMQNRLITASLRGLAPGHFTSGTAPGFAMGKVTIQRGADGQVERTWERQSPDQDQVLEALRSAVEAMAGEIRPAAPVPPPAASLEGLLTLYTWTDYHVGMLAWHKEGGDDWDCSIAESTGNAAMDYLVSSAPASKRAIVNIQGDFLHWDGLQAITPTHGHVLDADSRFGKVVDVAIKLIRSLIAKALTKHEEVTLLICEGNHDIASSLWLRKLFACLYELEPRVTVHDSELPYYAIQHGEVMLGFHHGHLRKNEQLPALFAAQFREMWGQCKRAYIHTGHRHHMERKDYPGARLIQHPTLAARDAHASRGGWFSDREITAITYSRKAWANEVNWTPEMLGVAA